MNDLEIIKNYYSFNTEQAKKYMKAVSKKTISEIKKGFESNAKKCFYQD